MGGGHAERLQNCRERIQPPVQLGEAMLHEAISDDQTQWDRSPARDRGPADQIDGNIAPHCRPPFDVARRLHNKPISSGRIALAPKEELLTRAVIAMNVSKIAHGD